MTQPNILFICTDQQRYDAVGAAGNPHITTPNLDRLAAQGTLFENCYVQNTVCSPSRASLMTGRYVPAHGLYANGVDLDPSEVLFSRDLADAGYDCGLVGKLHLGACFDGRSEPRLDDGFRVFRWAHAPAPGSSENTYQRWLRARFPDLYASVRSGEGPYNWANLPTEAHYSHWIGDETTDFLRTSRDDGKPFLFIANFFDPHPAFGAPEEYIQRYDAAALPAPIRRDGELAGKPPVHAEGSTGVSREAKASTYADLSADQLAGARRAYYAMVTLIDDEVGRILDTLEEAGLADNTIVVFTSDHGEMLGDHELILKGPYLYEGAIRVPLIIRWPGVTEPGSRRSELVQWVDLAPTFLDAAGVTVPGRMQGESLIGLLRGEAAGWRDWAVCHYRDSGPPFDPPSHQTMLRHDRWKLVVHHGTPTTSRERTGELYDLAADPDELINLWHEGTHRDTRLELQEKLLDVMVATEDRGRPRVAPW